MGASVVNALSTNLDVKVMREDDENVYGMDFKLGKVATSMTVVGKCPRHEDHQKLYNLHRQIYHRHVRP